MKKIMISLLLIILLMPVFVNAETCDLDKISISSITMENKSDTVTELDEANASGKNISLKLDMVNVEDNINYKITIKNDSKSDYELDNNSFNSGSEYIVYSVKSEDNNNIVKAKSSKSFLLNVQYKNKIPEDKFINGEFNYSKNLKLVLSADSLKNPNTFNSIIFVVIILLFLSIITLISIKKKKTPKSIVLLGLLLIPISVNAVCKYEININSKIIIEGKDLYEVDNGPYYNINKDKKYPTLAVAVARARSNQTIKVLEEIPSDNTEVKVNIPESMKGLKLDLNGKVVDLSYVEGQELIVNNGEFEIFNSSDEEARIDYETTIINNGTLSIKDNNTIIYSQGDAIDNNGLLNVYDGDIVASEGEGIVNRGTLNMSGGKVSGNNAISNYNIANITGGFTYSIYGVANNENGHMVIDKDAVITGTTRALFNDGNLEINGAEVSVHYAFAQNAIHNSGTANISNATISLLSTGDHSDIDGIYNQNGELNVKSVTITLTKENYSTGCQFTGIRNKATANISDTTITIGFAGNSTNYLDGVGIVSEGTTTFKSGTITVPMYGAQVKSNGTLTLGSKDGNVDLTSPVLHSTGSSSRGVDVAEGGIFNFYDGTIKVKRSNTDYLILGSIADIPNGYTIHKEDDGQTRSAYLVAN